MAWGHQRFINADGGPAAAGPIVGALQRTGTPVTAPGVMHPTTVAPPVTPTSAGQVLGPGAVVAPAIHPADPTTAPAVAAAPAGQVDARAGNPTGNTNAQGQVYNASTGAYETQAADPNAAGNPNLYGGDPGMWAAMQMTANNQAGISDAGEHLIQATGGYQPNGYPNPTAGKYIAGSGMDPNVGSVVNALRQGLTPEQAYARVTGSDGSQGNGMQGMSQADWMAQINQASQWMKQHGVSGGGSTGFTPADIAGHLQRANAPLMGPGGQVIPPAGPPPGTPVVSDPAWPPAPTYGYGAQAYEAPPATVVNYGR